MNSYEIRDGDAVVATETEESKAIGRSLAVATQVGHEVHLYLAGELVMHAWPAGRLRWVGPKPEGEMDADESPAVAIPAKRTAPAVRSAKSARMKATR